MKGLEPSTFCMASRRSSQLSYIRARPSIARAFRGRRWRLVRRGVERLVDEPVGELVVLAAHGGVGDAADLPGEPGRLAVQSPRSASFFTRYSPRICLTSSSESETTSSSSTPSSTARRSPSTSARYSATLFVATPIASPRARARCRPPPRARTPYAAGPGLPRAPPSVESRAFTALPGYGGGGEAGEQHAGELGAQLLLEPGADRGPPLLDRRSPLRGELAVRGEPVERPLEPRRIDVPGAALMSSIIVASGRTTSLAVGFQVGARPPIEQVMLPAHKPAWLPLGALLVRED